MVLYSSWLATSLAPIGTRARETSGEGAICGSSLQRLKELRRMISFECYRRDVCLTRCIFERERGGITVWMKKSKRCSPTDSPPTKKRYVPCAYRFVCCSGAAIALWIVLFIVMSSSSSPKKKWPFPSASKMIIPSL